LSLRKEEKKKRKMAIISPWDKGKKISLFAGRSSLRPNPIGLELSSKGSLIMLRETLVRL